MHINRNRLLLFSILLPVLCPCCCCCRRLQLLAANSLSQAKPRKFIKRLGPVLSRKLHNTIEAYNKRWVLAAIEVR